MVIPFTSFNVCSCFPSREPKLQGGLNMRNSLAPDNAITILSAHCNCNGSRISIIAEQVKCESATLIGVLDGKRNGGRGGGGGGGGG